MPLRRAGGRAVRYNPEHFYSVIENAICPKTMPWFPSLAAAEDLRVPLPLANILRDRFLTLLAHGGERLDWSAIGQLAAKDAGET